jgi:hypothetical protein
MVRVVGVPAGGEVVAGLLTAGERRRFGSADRKYRGSEWVS